ncbi:peptide chain release factor N(5)-glutamine methyltransferase [Sarracenia purpurea var. burkii]
MRLGFTRSSLSIFSPIFHANPSRPTTCLSKSPPPTSPKLQTPLFLRPPTFSATLSNLWQWKNWAKTLSSSVGSKFMDADNGPDTTLLHRELNWLIEDALENPKSFLTYLGTNNMVGFDNAEITVALRADLQELYALWKQRIEERRPFQYIVGCEHWRDLVLSVQEGVLIPRPETELIVDIVGGLIKGNEELREGLWADLGTGSGALAIGIARILGTRGRIIATDLSPVAVEVASYNVRRYNLQDKIGIKLGSWFEPLKDVEGQFVGLVSNPPYIPSNRISGLQAEVGKHEPRLALDGGANGMDDLIHLCHGVALMLKPGGFFAFETNGEEQCMFLVDYMQNESKGSFCDIDIVSDFAGTQRFVTGFKERSIVNLQTTHISVK